MNEQEKLEEWQRNVFTAVAYQARDITLWISAQNIREAHLQQALINLHKVIETNDLNVLEIIMKQVEI